MARRKTTFNIEVMKQLETLDFNPINEAVNLYRNGQLQNEMAYVKIFTELMKYTYPALKQVEHKFDNDDKQFQLPIFEVRIVDSAEQNSDTD